MHPFREEKPCFGFVSASRETHNSPLLAVTLGRKSFVPIYSNDAQKALPLLQEAYAQLTDNTSDIIRAWLSLQRYQGHPRSLFRNQQCQLLAVMAEWMTCKSGPPTC